MLNNIYDTINSIYNKNCKSVDVTTFEQSDTIVLTKLLLRDCSNLSALKQITNYLFYLKPEYYFYLLVCNIPYQFKAPFLKKTTGKINEKNNKLLDKIKYILNYSSKEFNLYKHIFFTQISEKSKYWESELGIK